MPPKPLADDRVVVNLSAAHPELLCDLAAIPRRARAARLRHLAAVGLAALRGGAVTVALAPAAAPNRMKGTPGAVIGWWGGWGGSMRSRSTRIAGRLRGCQPLKHFLLCLTAMFPIAGMAGLPDWDDTARRHGIEPMVLYAAGLLASGRIEKGQASPWPWTLTIDGRRAHYRTRADAAQALASARRADVKHIAIGVMDIPMQQRRLGDEPSDLLDPRRNLDRGAALIASGLRAHPSDRALGIGRYRSASDADAKIFGARVLALVARLKERAKRPPPPHASAPSPPLRGARRRVPAARQT